MNDLCDLAERFRSALETCLDSFPAGCCTAATEAFGRYLYEEHGIEVVGMNGRRKWTSNFHDWLQVGDLFVDLTMSQFDQYPRFRPLPSSLVLPASYPWHRRHFTDWKQFDAIHYPKIRGTRHVDRYPDLVRIMHGQG